MKAIVKEEWNNYQDKYQYSVINANLWGSEIAKSNNKKEMIKIAQRINNGEDYPFTVDLK